MVRRRTLCGSKMWNHDILHDLFNTHRTWKLERDTETNKTTYDILFFFTLASVCPVWRANAWDLGFKPHLSMMKNHMLVALLNKLLLQTVPKFTEETHITHRLVNVCSSPVGCLWVCFGTNLKRFTRIISIHGTKHSKYVVYDERRNATSWTAKRPVDLFWTQKPP